MKTITEDTLFAQKIKSIFNAQKLQQHIVKQTTAEERIEKLKKFRNVVVKYKVDAAKALFADFQRPYAETYALEVSTLLNHIDYSINNVKEWLKREPVTPAFPATIPFTAELVYEPKGVVLIVGPWNVPFFLTLYPLISAIAAGNTAFIKPSELTPSHSALLNKMITEIFDENEVTVVEGGVTETTELLKLPFDHIYFTGSPIKAVLLIGEYKN